MVGFKLWWLRVLVERYDAQTNQSLLAPDEMTDDQWRPLQMLAAVVPLQ
jgi:hypothetical protein